MFFNILKSEWTKLRSTASFWWTTGLVFVISVGVAAIISSAGNTADMAGTGGAVSMGTSPLVLTMPFTIVGLPILLIQAIMVVTTEYRFGLVPQNFLATPTRWPVMLAKFVLYAVIAAVISFLVVVLSYLVSQLLQSGDAAELTSPFEDETGKRQLWAIPLATVVAVLFVQGLGMLVRQTAGAVAITIIWLLGFDQFLRLIPKAGDDIAKTMPFQNMNNFLRDMPFEGTEWSSWSSLGVFALWAVVAWVAGLLLTLKRDA